MTNRERLRKREREQTKIGEGRETVTNKERKGDKQR